MIMRYNLVKFVKENAELVVKSESKVNDLITKSNSVKADIIVMIGDGHVSKIVEAESAVRPLSEREASTFPYDITVYGRKGFKCTDELFNACEEYVKIKSVLSSLFNSPSVNEPSITVPTVNYYDMLFLAKNESFMVEDEEIVNTDDFKKAIGIVETLKGLNQ